MISALRLRQWHAYFGLFIAPSLLFFAATGALQIFNLHEAHGRYKPAPLIEKLSAVHKDQVFEAHDHSPPPEPQAVPPGAGGPAQPPPGDDDDKGSASTLALKWYFLLVSVGLIISTLIGIWMGTTQIRRKSTAWGLLIAGTALPIVLLVI